MISTRIISLFGIFAFLFLSWLLSTDRKCVNWRLLGCGVAMQLALGFFIFNVPAGRGFFEGVNTGFGHLVEAANHGPEFVLGALAKSPGEDGSIGFVLLTQALPLIIVFSALIAVLYQLGIMQKIINVFAKVFTKVLGISGAESLSSASNMFVGVESALTIKPYLKKMTSSELCTILTVCMATVASNVIAAYHIMLSAEFPSITGHLVSASLLSAPAALMTSKLLLPETEVPETLGTNVQVKYEKEDGLFNAIISGANSGLQLLMGIASLLIAVVGLLYILNMLLEGAGDLFGMTTPLSLQLILGYIFQPFVWLTGIPWNECELVGQLVGQRLILTEIPGYLALNDAMSTGAVSPRSAVIVAYTLCGFAHIPSMSIFVGGIAALVPERRSDLARVAPRALLAANLACLLTGCIAGLFASDLPSVLGLK